MASAHNKEKQQQRRTNNSVSPDTGEAQGTGDEQQEETPTPRDSRGESLGKERMAQLRSQLQAQLSIREPQEDLSPGSRLMKLVEKITHREADDGGAVSPNGSAGPEGTADSACAACGPHSDPAGYTGELPAEVEKKLQKELAALRGEVTASIEAMRKDVAEELNSLRETLQAYGEHHAPLPSELSPLEKQEEATFGQLKGPYHRAGQREKPGARIPSTLEEEFKARSVPSLCPLPGPNRNQVLLRAMSLVTAQKALTSKLEPRSNSDPVEPLQPKSTFLPPANLKPVGKKQPKKIMAPPTARGHQETGKCGVATKWPAE
ncbi:unnamed protein product [Caretta caretta]